MLRILRWTVLSLFIGVWIDGCAGLSNNTRFARTFKPLLLGKWCLPTVGQAGCRSHEEYRADGILQARFFDTEAKPVRLMRVKARYSFEDRRVCFDVVESDTDYFAAGQKVCSEILSVDSKSFTYDVDDSGVIDTMTRLPSSAPACPPLK